MNELDFSDKQVLVVGVVHCRLFQRIKQRALAIQAIPGTIRASATVSQPFSSDMVRASASAATVPVA